MSTGGTNGHLDEESRVRTRVSRACTRCRSRKDKCDGLRPSCSTCRSSGAAGLCAYEPSTKKRGLPEGYVRGLEKLNSLLLSKFKGLEDAVVRILQDEREELARVWNDRVTGEELHTRWKDSSMLHELEALLAALDQSPGPGNKRKREHDEQEDEALSTHADPSLEGILVPTHSLIPLSVPQAFSTQLQPQTIERPSPSRACFTLPPGASDAINDYFQFVHCWLPILDRGDMRKKCYELARREVLMDSSDPGLAKLSAALVLASLHVNMIPQAQQALDATFLYEVSKQCIPFVDGLYLTGHVQALILQVLADMSSNRWSQAWTSIGLAVRIALDIITPCATLDKQQTAALQACFILDTLTAVRLDRDPHMRRSHLATLLVEDGHEEWEPYSHTDTEPGFLISTFNRLTDLFTVLNNVLCSEGEVGWADDLIRLSQSYPFLLSETSQLPPHQIALKASHFAVTGYLQSKWAANILAGSQNVSTALNLLTSSSVRVSSVLATALLETVQRMVPIEGDTTSSSKRRRTEKSTDELDLWPADPFAQPLLPQTPKSKNQQQPSDFDQMHDTFPQLARSRSSTAMNFDVPGFAHRNSSATYNASIATSPSFQGDEIDALFREMAQLDTTEWADGRAQGLGFSDEMTFEAFCNDPDRVFSGNSIAPQQTTIMTQSNMGFPALRQDSRMGPNYETFDLMGTSWNG